jgi:hypothetical protein
MFVSFASSNCATRVRTKSSYFTLFLPLTVRGSVSFMGAKLKVAVIQGAKFFLVTLLQAPGESAVALLISVAGQAPIPFSIVGQEIQAPVGSTAVISVA